MYLGIVVFRAIFIIAIVSLIILVMGYKPMNRTTTFELLMLTTAGTIAGTAIVDLQTNSLNAIAAIIIIMIFYIFIRYVNSRIGKFIESRVYEPIILVYHGLIIKQNLIKTRMTLNYLLSVLREKGAFDIRQVAIACFEKDGKISVLKEKSDGHEINSDMPLPVVIEGKVQTKQLKKLGYSDKEIDLFSHNFKQQLDNIFVAFMDRNYNLHIVQNDVTVQKEATTDIYSNKR